MGLGIRDVRICFENPMTDDRRTQVKIIGTMFESHSLGYVSELRLNRQLQQIASCNNMPHRSLPGNS